MTSPADPTDPFFANDAWAQEAGIELMEVSDGRAKVRMRIAGWHLNSHGTVHGGAIFTLADTAFALASNSHGVPAAAINAHISYVKAATTGTLVCRCCRVLAQPKNCHVYGHGNRRCRREDRDLPGHGVPENGREKNLNYNNSGVIRSVEPWIKGYGKRSS